MKTVLFVFLMFAAFASLGQNVPVDSVKFHVGELVSVCGKVFESHATETGTIYLNFGGKYPNSSFTGVVFAKDTVKFTKFDVHTFLTDKNVCVSGRIEDYKGHLQVIIKHPEQIRIKEEDIH